MRSFEVAIVGGGLTGSLAAVMLGRRGFAVALIDPNAQYRPDFRAEKLEQHHVEALRLTGLADEIVPAARHYEGIWIARFGRLTESKPSEEYGIDYSALVNHVRSLIPSNVTFVRDTVRQIEVSPDLQTLTLASGEVVSSRLVVAANGLNAAVLGKLGMDRREIARAHSISLGFDVVPSTRFPFDALTYFGERPEHCISYLTLFPMGEGMRANLFLYRDLGDPWLRQFRDNPDAALEAALPRLKRLSGEFKVEAPVKVRPVDLYVTQNVIQPGIVLIGDAYATACPTSGTGASKGITDVAQLCNHYVSGWLASPGMAVEKIAAYYADPLKVQTDAHSMETSLFAKRIALEPGLQWHAYRLARFMGSAARGVLNVSRPALPPVQSAGSR